MTSTPSLPAQIEAVRDTIMAGERVRLTMKLSPLTDWNQDCLRAVLVTLQQHERALAALDSAAPGAVPDAVEPAITPEMLRAGISVAEAHFLRAHGAWRDLVVAVYRAMYLSRPSRSDETEVTLSRKDVAENTGDPR